jgi:hypothetical protein
MAELKFQDAEIIAGSLVTIGHPYAASAIRATAADLVKWCTGYTEGLGVIWTPSEQALWLIEEARLWVDGWPERGGTAKLLALFREKFKAPVVIQPLLGTEEAVSRGMIPPPCNACDDTLYVGKPPNVAFCVSCGLGKRNARWMGQSELDSRNAAKPAPRPERLPSEAEKKMIAAGYGPKAPLPQPERPRAELEKMIAEAQAVHENEKRRKKEQLAKLDPDYAEPPVD